MSSGDSTALQIRAGRALLGWSQKELADAARVGTSTVADFERGKRAPIPATIQALRRALENAGVHFVPNGAQLGAPEPPARPVTPIRWIEAVDLETWAERVEAAFELPTLVARLVLASVGRQAQVHFPSGEGVWAAGTDGEVTTNVVGHPYVPAGASIWELTRSKRKQDKAQQDYGKDTAALDSRADKTFVFVTLARWPGKARWVEERKAERTWRDVRAYDRDDLVHWIDLAPSVGAWLAEKLGKRPPGIRDLDRVWNEWSLATGRPLTAELVLCDRGGRSAGERDRGGTDEDAEAVADDNEDQTRPSGDVAVVHRWLEQPPALLELRGTSVLEVLAFLRAAIDELGTESRARHQARTIVATTVDAARALLDASSSFVMALTEPAPGLARHLVANGHHVLLAYDDHPTIGGDVRSLAKPSREGIAAALVAMGIEKTQAEKYARDCARDLTILRRLMPAAAIEIPTWAKQPPRALLAALLAGAWDESVDGDRAQVAAIANEPYDAVIAALTRFVGDHDLPLRRIGTTWRVASPRDAWMHLARDLTSADLARFADAVGEVLGAADPRFGMRPEDRRTAAIRGVEARYSAVLRHGLGQVLILLALWGDQCAAVAGVHRRAEVIVAQLLRDATPERWWSLGGELRLLAEAAPGAFLGAVEASLEQPEPAIGSLLATHGAALFGGEYFSNLLWALQTLAWSPEWLPRVTYILADLDARDTNPGRHTNRPMSGLHQIFVLWHPQTYATLDERFRIIDVLRRRHGGAAWKLLLSLLLHGQEIAMNTPSPRWRDLQPDRPVEKVTRGLVQRGSVAVTKRLLEDVGGDVVRWVQLVERLEDLAPDPTAGIDTLDRAASEVTEPKDRVTLWNALRSQLHRHRKFPSVAWAMRTDIVDRLGAIYDRLTPEDLVERYAWLFERHPKLPEPSGAGWQADEQAVEAVRRASAKILLAEGGIDAVIATSGRVETAGYLGRALYVEGLDETTLDTLLEASLRSDAPNVRNLGHGLILSAHAERGEAWATALLERATRDGWGETALVSILLALPIHWSTWEHAATAGPAVEQSYWKKSPSWWRSDDPAVIEHAVRKLIAVGRAHETLVLVDGSIMAKLASGLLIDILHGVAAGSEASDVDDVDTYHLANIFTVLDQRDDVSVQEIAVLEWTFLQHLEHSTRPPRALRKALATQPEFFVQILSLLYKPRGDKLDADASSADSSSADSDGGAPDEVVDERTRLRAMQAFHLLEGWDAIPGMRDDRTIDAAALESWIKNARVLAKDVGRLAVADLHIGKVLATAPKGADGHWPADAVRDAIDLFRSKDLESGVALGVYNRRGGTTRGLRDGGALERDLVTTYRTWGDEVRLHHPRTAAVLHAIADSYERDAARHDERAAQLDWEY
ncbi:MAG: helix-turn-helix domain-containing protein [Myxococcales bacterium]|nr:helix-turn-helix domain-containing protein [Myxococcales bacterium]